VVWGTLQIVALMDNFFCFRKMHEIVSLLFSGTPERGLQGEKSLSGTPESTFTVEKPLSGTPESTFTVEKPLSGTPESIFAGRKT
jgi:hypothetical protein